MIQPLSWLKVADNSGAKEIMCNQSPGRVLSEEAETSATSSSHPSNRQSRAARSRKATSSKRLSSARRSVFNARTAATSSSTTMRRSSSTTKNNHKALVFLGLSQENFVTRITPKSSLSHPKCCKEDNYYGKIEC